MIEVYAILERVPPRASRAPARGASGEPLRFVEVGPLVVAAGTVERAPILCQASIVKRDALIRALAEATDSILPTRWGSLVDDEKAVAEELAPRVPALAAALERVRGCEQMDIHAAITTAPNVPPRARGEARTGTGYLEQRARELAAEQEAPELEELLRAVAKVTRGARVLRRGLLLGVSHLIERGCAEEYRRLAVPVKLAVPFRVSGPDPPYAFAPEL